MNASCNLEQFVLSMQVYIIIICHHSCYKYIKHIGILGNTYFFRAGFIKIIYWSVNRHPKFIGNWEKTWHSESWSISEEVKSRGFWMSERPWFKFSPHFKKKKIQALLHGPENYHCLYASVFSSVKWWYEQYFLQSIKKRITWNAPLELIIFHTYLFMRRKCY